MLRSRRIPGLAAVAVSILLAGSARAAQPSGFTVDFTDCIESIGVTLVATEAARPVVPPGFVLAGEGGPVTPAVVRTARCGISVDGSRPRSGAIVQIGLVLVPPDFTGDINSYTVEYYTSDAKLAERLRHAGVAAQHVENLGYDYTSASPASLAVNVPLPGRPQLAVGGPVTASAVSAGSFLANWWAGSGAAPVKMGTNVPDIEIGKADLTMVTSPTDSLGILFGSGTVTFPIIQQFNGFANAQMTVSLP
jgi:hypothetical protein